MQKKKWHGNSNKKLYFLKTKRNSYMKFDKKTWFKQACGSNNSFNFLLKEIKNHG